MKKSIHYIFLIDFFIVITLREVLSNRLLKVIINYIVVGQFFCNVFNTEFEKLYI